ncbi:T9SS type A sorting domain-containing protein [Olleya sp. Bg11-27]|uniref:T9SS type A sorting domain-containing protein n=1 Tax=Olleya sp. Bg11-27 TaxID=2058135 RepID=UPI000C304DF4|nr:T9SS type A sorting domain-containing protein [Olleya sp. Bg11-27]AUC76794.1 hypothetical protein CW732_14355 [Olleya sp. Bg11-27]
MKKNLLYALLVCPLYLSLAQLTVRNDAYIFVDGTGFDDTVADVAPLFVENNINLQEANSTIYLRNEAQVIQGTGVTGNSGLGKLSVYQQGTVNSYAYNYWASPVGNVSVNTTGNSTFIPNQNIYDITDLTNSTLAGYATSGYNGTSAPLNIESYWLWKYNPGVDYSAWDFVGASGFVDAGYGFTMKGTIGSTSIAGQQYDFRGKPNAGEITTDIALGQETLIGNPYPSALDASAFIHDPNNIPLLDAGTLYYWEQDQSITSHVLTSYRGGYGAYTIDATGTVDSYVAPPFNAYNADGSLNTSGASSTSGKEARRYIPVGQGYMVKGAATGTLLTSDSHRVFYKKTGAQSEFYRTAENNTEDSSERNTIVYDTNGVQILPEDFKRFRLNVDFGSLYTRQLLHNFHQTASPDFDYGLESKVYGALSADANWIQNNEAYVTKADNYQIDLKIPLNLNLDAQQVLNFRLTDIQNFDYSQPIYLHDIDNNLYIDLRQQDFQISLPIGNYATRFEITFEETNTLSTVEFVENNFNVLQNNTISELVILNPNSLSINFIELYDISGKLIFNKQVKNTNTRLSYSTKNLSDGVYLVKTTLSNNNTTTKKVIVANKK